MPDDLYRDGWRQGVRQAIIETEAEALKHEVVMRLAAARVLRSHAELLRGLLR